MSKIREILDKTRKILKSKTYRDALDEFKRNPAYEPVRMVQTPDISAVDLYMLEKLDNIKQADWNQNDENAPDFIKNRICYKEGEVSISTVISNTGQINFYTNDFIPLEEGVIYKSLIDGVVYESLPTTIVGLSGLQAIFSLGDNGSFALVYIPSGIPSAPDGKRFCLQGGSNPAVFGEKTLTVYSPKFTSIDARCIPNTIVRTGQLGGVQFKIDGTDLQASLDGGSSWKTVTLT